MLNKAKIEGITAVDHDAQVRFIAVEDDVTTKMCRSLDNQIFNVKDLNEFYRYSATNTRLTKYKCYGLIPGLNLPPIDDSFHWCRSTIRYLENESRFKDNSIVKHIYGGEEFGKSKYLNKEVENICNLVYNQYMKNGFENITLVDTKTSEQLGEIHTDYKVNEVYLSSF